jgi:aldose 1-epimerase
VIEQRAETVNGEQIDVITMTDGAWKAVFTNLGARLIELHVPDENGDTVDVVLQRSSLSEMATDDNYFGATAGRYANRIRAGRFDLDGTTVQLSVNEGDNHLHGGTTGFDRHVWQTRIGDEDNTVAFTRTSPDGEEGYPGNLHTEVTYTLAPPALDIAIRATTDAPTVANIVNHSYFNVAGHGAGTVLDHLVRINGSFYTPVDDELLATGEIRSVDQTPFDFRTPTPVGDRLHDVSNAAAGRTTDDVAGYDHNWVLDGTGMREVFEVTDPTTGRRLTMSTNRPGLQVYVGGYLKGVTAKAPLDAYPAFAGLTLETQTFPGSPNHAHFPSSRLEPGQTYVNSVHLEFSTAPVGIA